MWILWMKEQYDEETGQYTNLIQATLLKKK